MAKFKVGDKIVCTAGCVGLLSKGHEYSVLTVEGEYIRLVEVDTLWHSCRFKAVESPKTVKDMTDEELALVCREHYPAFYDAYTELVTARKFTWGFDVNTRVVTFKKTETVTTTKEL